ncbi:hypothetical protein [Rhodovulum sulfidophilum]|uniref:hypothetical protein n=1 Tax=Rhodovulum sulfidophilum TaxID=35806 RepID=UPI000951D4E7|nr:hypothetical protein [Rhodovulum sulfidophilum]MBL3553149.1 hypothetical protein [Rhodovulum sulfidophilum]OLS50203.1 hypothetical protein BV379_19220 [Rhodovulum sulfidophilum]
MSVLGVVVTLRDPVVIPAQAATATRPQSLSYIPGATLLGIAAGRLYGELATQDAFAAFHAGAVRFGDAFALADSGHICLPVPISLHEPKTRGDKAPSATDERVRDFAAAERGQDFVQIRGRDCVMDGCARFHELGREASMRTAIAAETGLADEGQLYGYEALSAGQRFRARLDGDVALLARIGKALKGDHFIGRSRTAEFGRVRIEIEEASYWQLASGAAARGRRFVWLLSDAWFFDRYGFPTARPDADMFCPGCAIDWAHSFIRTRRVAPYNTAWRARAEERTLVTRGSVITLENCSLVPGLQSFGMGQERGLGMAFVSSHPIGEVLCTDAGAVTPPAPACPPLPAPTAFTNWLKGKQAGIQSRATAAATSDDDLQTLRGLYRRARHIAGEPVGPTASQWSGLATFLASDIQTGSLLGTREDRDSRLWGARYGLGEGDTGTFRDFVTTILKAKDGRTRLRLLAQKARRAIEEEEWLDPQRDERGAVNDQ